MFEPANLLTMHQRTHQGFAGLLAHCRRLSAEELRREHTSSGYPSVQLLLHHIIIAEHYWVDVAAGRFTMDSPYGEDDVTQYPDVDSLEQYRAEVAADTAGWLSGVTLEQLNTPREHEVWGGGRRLLHPAMIVLRVITHHFHHRGQLQTMLRLLGHPVDGNDFPVTP